MVNVALASMFLLLPNNESRVKIDFEVNSISNYVVDSAVYPRLSVNPKKDATGTENKTAGTVELEGIKGYYLHVPEKAVGKKRVPLVLLLHGGGRNGSVEMAKFKGLADKYGIIMLTASSLTPGRWDAIGHIASQRSKWESTEKGGKPIDFKPKDVTRLDSALKYVLKNQAIDPGKIALLGFSDGGSYSFLLGRSNLDVFSRVAPLSGLMPFYGEGPANPSTQFFISGGLGEGNIISQVIRMASVLRADGHLVKTQVGLRGHVDYVEDEDFVWDWLLDSWKDPKITAVVPPLKDSALLLTTDVLEKLTTFWSDFFQYPDSIRTEARMNNQREVWIRVGSEWTTTIMMDLKAIADKYPEVSKSLEKAGLTAEEADSYRKALVEAHYTMRAGLDGDAVDSTAVLAKSIKFKPIVENSTLFKNIEFLKANKSDFQRVAQRGILSLQ